MVKKSNDKLAGKTFSLKPIEQQMLKVLQDQYFAVLSNFLSFVALERLAYKVTEKTQFKLEGDSVVITEAVEIPDVPEQEEVATA